MNELSETTDPQAASERSAATTTSAAASSSTASTTAASAPSPGAQDLLNLDATSLRSAAERDAVQADYLFRGKMHFLAAQNAHYSQQLQFSDAKGATLITLIGILSVNAPIDLSAPAPLDLLFLLFASISIGMALWSVTPKVPASNVRLAISRHDRFSWPGLADEDPERFAAFAAEADVPHLVQSIARGNAAMAKILLKKFQSLRLAFIAGAVSGALFFARVLLDGATVGGA